jgi:uncharacterized membrane protein YfhO
MQGWSATVNGEPAPIGISDGVFQTIDLPAGDARIRFTYEPPGFKLALVAAATALLFVCSAFIGFIRGRKARPARALAGKTS